MKKILFIDNQQFGYLTDSYKYCEILKDRYKITYLCFDKGWEKLTIEGVKVKYVSRIGSKPIRAIWFLLRAIYEAGIFNGFIFVIYFTKFHIIKQALPWKKMHIDIRTLSVSNDPLIREKTNIAIKNAVQIYDTASAISTGIISQISSNKNIYLLPLGADVISSSDKNFETLRLLYVGTLTNRDILKTVIGFNLFIKSNPNIIIKYDIVGDGDDYDKIADFVKREKIEESVTLYGSVPHNQLRHYFDRCNIGVSFVPMTDYYDYQPPTKTFEYAFSGLFTIATGTFANKEIITPENGCIIDDNVDDFVRALHLIVDKRHAIDSSNIRKSVEYYSWKNIVNNYLEPIIQQR